jgi:hypothetical protein
MIKFQSLKMIVLAIGIAALSACASMDVSQAGSLPAAKVDNGLGELPHYRDWIDPTGRAPMEPMLTAEDARWP